MSWSHLSPALRAIQRTSHALILKILHQGHPAAGRLLQVGLGSLTGQMRVCVRKSVLPCTYRPYCNRGAQRGLKHISNDLPLSSVHALSAAHRGWSAGCPDLSPSPDPPASGLVAAGSSAPAMDAWQVRFRLTSNMVKTTKQALMDKLRNTVGVDLASRATHILAEIQDPNVLRPYALLPESSFVKVQSRAKLRCVTGMSTGDLGPMTVKQFSQMKSKGLPVSEVVEYSTDGAIWKAFTASNVCNDLSG